MIQRASSPVFGGTLTANAAAGSRPGSAGLMAGSRADTVSGFERRSLPGAGTWVAVFCVWEGGTDATVFAEGRSFGVEAGWVEATAGSCTWPGCAPGEATAMPASVGTFG